MTDSLQKIDTSGLASLVAEARDRATARRTPILVSYSHALPAIDPLEALANVSRANSSPAIARCLNAGRMYWSYPRDGFALAGIGAVATFAPNGENRFEAVDGAWTTLLENGLIDESTRNAAAGGPVLMGGFSFDQRTSGTGEWKDFPRAHMIVPALLIASAFGQSSATFSIVVDVEGKVSSDVDELVGLFEAANSGSYSAGRRVSSDDDSDELSFSDSQPAEQWRELIAAAVREIRKGAFDKVVLAREVHATASDAIDIFVALDHLRATHRNSFVFSYWRGDSAFIGATPERLVKLDGREVRASSLAGTEKRGSTPAEDSRLSSSLLASTKDLAEHAAVRDALFSALSEISDEVSAAETPSLLTLPHVHHLHTPVTARLREGHSLLDVVSRLHPTPAVGGTPRNAALRFIREHEDLDRGWYAAPIGWIGRDSGEFAVALRSALVSGSEASLFAGCGVVADSDPDMEFNESMLKLRPMKSAITAALENSRSDLSEIGAASDVTK